MNYSLLELGLEMKRRSPILVGVSLVKCCSSPICKVVFGSVVRSRIEDLNYLGNTIQKVTVVMAQKVLILGSHGTGHGRTKNDKGLSSNNK